MFSRYRKKDMWQTQWPDWVYKQFDPHHLATRITEKVKMLCKIKLIIYLTLYNILLTS